MSVRLPADIENLILARVGSGDFASPEEVLRSAMAPWIAREQARSASLDELPRWTNCARRLPKVMPT